MKRLEVLNNNIDLLNLDSIIEKKLNNIGIFKIEELWKCTGIYLKENKFTSSEITKIKIKLQLLGLDLNKKVY